MSSCFVLNIDRSGGVLVVGVAGILKKKSLPTIRVGRAEILPKIHFIWQQEREEKYFEICGRIVIHVIFNFSGN